VSETWAEPGGDGVTRGQLLLGGAGLLMGGAVLGTARQLAPEVSETIAKTEAKSNDLFRLAVFAPLVGTNFRVVRPGLAPVDLRLNEVRDLTIEGQPTYAFSLRFAGTRNVALEQDTYIMRNRRLGQFGLFIVPMGIRGSRREYEAVVNRFH
jgi:hypothetical protein